MEGKPMGEQTFGEAYKDYAKKKLEYRKDIWGGEAVTKSNLIDWLVEKGLDRKLAELAHQSFGPAIQAVMLWRAEASEDDSIYHLFEELAWEEADFFEFLDFSNAFNYSTPESTQPAVVMLMGLVVLGIDPYPTFLKDWEQARQTILDLSEKIHTSKYAPLKGWTHTLARFRDAADEFAKAVSEL